MMKTDNTFVIDPQGYIYKCISGVGYDAFKAGSIFDTQYLSWQLSQFSEMNAREKSKVCQQCRYLPLCLGGCPQQLFVRTGTLEGIDCQKAALSIIVPAMVRSLYSRQINATNNP